MERSTYSKERYEEDPDSMTSYIPGEDGEPIPSKPVIHELLFGRGGLLCPVMELTNYLTANIYEGRYKDVELLSTELMEKMHSIQIETPRGWHGSGSAKQTTDLGYIIAGYTSPTGYDNSLNACLIKIDSAGNEEWPQPAEFDCKGTKDVFASVQQTDDGGYIAAGYTEESPNSDRWDMYLVKTDAEGKMLWYKTYGGSSNDMGYSAQLTTDGGCIMVGWTVSYGVGGRDVYLVKTNSEGRKQWDRTFGGGPELSWIWMIVGIGAAMVGITVIYLLVIRKPSFPSSACFASFF